VGFTFYDFVVCEHVFVLDRIVKRHFSVCFRQSARFARVEGMSFTQHQRRARAMVSRAWFGSINQLIIKNLEAFKDFFKKKAVFDSVS